MKTSTVLAAAAAFGAATVQATPLQRRELPGLNALQTQNALAIIGECKNEGLGKQGCLVAITTAITESTLQILANNIVPPSKNFHFDGLGADNDSIGLYQQRAVWYKDIQCDMDAACSTRQFFNVMKTVNGWQTMEVGSVCQAVQRSEKPDAYAGHVAQAVQICSAAGFP